MQEQITDYSTAPESELLSYAKLGIGLAFSELYTRNYHSVLDYVSSLSGNSHDGENDPRFKSKIYLARKLINDALLNGIDFSHIVMDPWYFAVDLVTFIDNKGFFWISEADANRQISYRGKWGRTSA